MGKGCEKLGGESCQNSRRNLAENWEKAGRKLGEGAEAARESGSMLAEIVGTGLENKRASRSHAKPGLESFSVSFWGMV